MGDKGEGGHTIQQRETRTKKDKLGDQLGDKGDKASGRHTIQQRETRRETMGDTRRQGGSTIQQGNKKGTQGGDKTLGRWRNHPTQADM